MLYRVFAKYRKKCKVYRPFWKDFIVSEAKYILRQPSGNDYCGFYVMHFIHIHTGDDMSAGEDLVSYVQYFNTFYWFSFFVAAFKITWLSEKIFSILIHSLCSHSLLQRVELRTSELLQSDIVALQEELAGFIIYHVANPDAEFCVI